MHVALCDKFRRVAFTLAEVLITLGIIGVVAALTLPSLIDKYQKHVYYTQFMKAASSIENAFNTFISGDFGYTKENFVDVLSDYWWADFMKIFNISKKIDINNFNEVCSGYNKLPIGSPDGTDRDCDAECACYGEIGDDNPFGFITNDGILIMLNQDGGAGSGQLFDTNGPDKGPNLYGRDVFYFYPTEPHWGGTIWGHDSANIDFLGLRLIQEGKMNY